MGYVIGMRLRGLLWLVALCAFLLPPAATQAMVAGADHPMPIGCHDSAPPPCPDKGTAKHAAGLCCALMAQVLAVLPAETGGVVAAAGIDAPPAARSLTGLVPHKDPPPPRV